MKDQKKPLGNEEPTAWDYSRLYLRMYNNGNVDTLIIIHPDGTCERMITFNEGNLSHNPDQVISPCWSDHYRLISPEGLGVCRSARVARKRMLRHDNSVSELYYLGELK